MRVPQPPNQKGSLGWIQLLVEDAPDALTDPIRAAFRLDASWGVHWVSPRRADAWAEYRDSDFLEVLGLGELKANLGRFWPSGGPQWDALGKSRDGGVVLVEAKAHASELASNCQAEAPDSIARIGTSLDAAKHAFGAAPKSDWKSGFYQYANRLAHLHFLLSHRVLARLVFVYFLGDTAVGGLDTSGEWLAILDQVHRHLGIAADPPSVASVFIDVAAGSWNPHGR